MVETIRYSKIYKNDIAIGTGAAEVELNAGEVAQLSELNLSHFHSGDNTVLYASSDATQDSVFLYDPDNNRLFVPEIAGGSASGADVRIKGTTHATQGFVTLNEDGGNVGIGIDTPTETLHIQDTANTGLLIDESSTGDPYIAFALAAVKKFVIGVDNSSSDALVIAHGTAVGSNNDLRIHSTGNVAIGTTSDEAKLHIATGDSSVVPSGNADEVFIEGSGNSGITIGSGATSNGSIRFGRELSVSAGIVDYDHNTDEMTFTVGAFEALRITADPVIYVNYQAASSYVDVGLVIDQTNNATIAVLLQDSDVVAHGMTDFVDTSGFFYIHRLGASGGAFVSGLSASTIGMQLMGRVTTETTTDGDTSACAIQVIGALKSGTGDTALGATGNVFGVVNDTTTVLIVNGDGDVANSGGSTAMTTYDDYDDVRLLQTIKGAMAPNYRASLGAWVDEHTEILERTGVIKRRQDGAEGYWISQRGWRGLLIDAIGQLSRRIDALESLAGGAA